MIAPSGQRNPGATFAAGIFNEMQMRCMLLGADETVLDERDASNEEGVT